MTEDTPEFAADLLRGAEEIARFLYADPAMRRKVYHLAATSNLPIFKLGSMLCARRSVLLRWIEDQERRHANDNHTPAGGSAKIGKV